MEQADTVFFPIIYGAKDRHIIPEKARKEPFAGIAVLEPRIPHRMLVNAAEGITKLDGKIVIFSTFSMDEDRSEETMLIYAKKIKDIRTSYRVPVILINIVPEPVYHFLCNKQCEGMGTMYYHDPAVQKEKHLFAITVNSRIRAYQVEDPFGSDAK